MALSITISTDYGRLTFREEEMMEIETTKDIGHGIQALLSKSHLSEQEVTYFNRFLKILANYQAGICEHVWDAGVLREDEAMKRWFPGQTMCMLTCLKCGVMKLKRTEDSQNVEKSA